eukprot:CAMPEP_0203750950 /NCGR_PEP_ID=MMETSP0098-20131031/5109_1 /ASSEMBLY_ACC=CAM_ASM_000208 /TAXON_ID=96639 /ORGANISM=" , Strain NY0313808BC1" /LENGTH=167 /DNA_ID=CAMNT_0050640461 /DNA_START=225 /DNA_END=728 /DNA_ORIENTATION=+
MASILSVLPGLIETLCKIEPSLEHKTPQGNGVFNLEEMIASASPFAPSPHAVLMIPPTNGGVTRQVENTDSVPRVTHQQQFMASFQPSDPPSNVMRIMHKSVEVVDGEDLAVVFHMLGQNLKSMERLMFRYLQEESGQAIVRIPVPSAAERVIRVTGAALKGAVSIS